MQRAQQDLINSTFLQGSKLRTVCLTGTTVGPIHPLSYFKNGYFLETLMSDEGERVTGRNLGLCLNVDV
jgi:hypothetical protein